ncbi:phage tail assembly chaperone, partial [Klebsiella pneumoniae]|uniref:phage tail assembly chaperone n=1 Tax=Klebsiella pneumoniae TaxID=573 RepID=UPI001D0E8AAE
MEFEIKGVKYRTAKLDVFQQLKVSRKLLPVLAGLVSDFGTLKSMMVRDSEGKLVFGEKRAFDALDIVLPKIADTLAALPEEDVNAVIHPCLGVVMRQHEKGWVKIFDQGALMFVVVKFFWTRRSDGRVMHRRATGRQG